MLTHNYVIIFHYNIFKHIYDIYLLSQIYKMKKSNKSKITIPSKIKDSVFTSIQYKKKFINSNISQTQIPLIKCMI